MSTKFTIDLSHPGRAHYSRSEWFVGPGGPRSLGIVAAGGLAIVVLIALGGVLPRYLRYSSDIEAVARLRSEVTKANNELATLRTNLRELNAEARRQVRWSEMLTVLSRRLPGTLRVDRVSLAKAGARPPQGQPQGQPQPSGDLTFQIEANTTVVPGGSRLEEVAGFMAGLAQDPVVARRFQLKNWELKPAGQGGAEQLHISIGLAEKRS